MRCLHLACDRRGAPTRLLGLIAALALVLTGSGCATYFQPFEVDRAMPAPRSAAAAELMALPPPQEPVVVAVYRFRDQTGQYRALENVSTFSTAVTQGTTSILVRALEDSGWFVPIEREGLSNLLNERQIIQSIRAQHTGPEGEPLGPIPPLLYAGVLLEGGVVGYDTNLLTSGAGVRYFGAGGSGAVRQDQVTVYLRAVSTQTGRVLKTVYTTKTILSQRVEGGIFRYVALRRLLEAEAGYSFNEPPVVAVTQAIEEAVRGLIVEGVRDGLWSLQNPGDITHAAFEAYDRDREMAEQTDVFNRLLRDGRPMLGIGATAGGVLYQGDYRNPLLRPAAGGIIRVPLTRRIGFDLTGSAGELAADGAFQTLYGAADVSATYTFLPRSPVTPFVSAGLGVLFQPDPPRAGSDGIFPYVTAGGGVEARVHSSMGVFFGAGFNYPLVEGLDGVHLGRLNDSFLTFRSGLVYYMRF